MRQDYFLSSASASSTYVGGYHMRYDLYYIQYTVYILEKHRLWSLSVISLVVVFFFLSHYPQLVIIPRGGCIQRV